MDQGNCPCREWISEHVPKVISDIIWKYTSRRDWSHRGPGYKIYGENYNFDLFISYGYFVVTYGWSLYRTPGPWIFHFDNFEEFNDPKIIDLIIDDQIGDPEYRAAVSMVVDEIRNSPIICDHGEVH